MAAVRCGRGAGISALLLMMISCATTYQSQVGKGDDYLKAERYDDSALAYEEALILADGEGVIVTKEIYVSLAQSYEALGNINKAIVYYRRGASMDGGYPEVFFKMGTLQEGQGKLPEAAASYQSALSLDSENEAYLKALRRTMEGANLHGAFVDVMIERVADEDDGSQTLKELGLSYLESGQQDAGVQALEGSLALKAEQPDILSTLGSYYLSQGMMADAHRVFSALRPLTPEDIPTLKGLGESKLALDDGPGALEVYQYAVSLDPSDDSLKAGAQVARHLVGEDKLALKILNRLSRKSPNEPSLHWAAARIHLDLGHLKAAESTLGTAAYLAPDAFETQWLSGAIDLAQGRFDGAIAPLSRARALRPKDPRSAALLCRAYDGSGATSDEALDACDDALELNPEDMSLVQLNAGLLLKAGRYDEGVSAYLRLIRSGALGQEAPTFEVGQMLLALERGEDAEGLALGADGPPELMALLSRAEAEVYGDDRGRSRAEAALGKGKSDVRVLSEVARFYITIDEPLEAKALVNKAKSKGAQSGDVIRAEGALHIAQGRSQEAVELLRARVAKHPEDVDAQALLAKALAAAGQEEDAKALRKTLGLR